MARESAIDVRLPALSPLLDRWRLPTCPDAARGMPPHITLLYPWRPAPVRAADLAALAAAVAGASPLVVTFPELGRFPGVLYLRPDLDDALRALTRRLAAAFPDTPPYGGRFPDPTPHLTVAQAPADDQLDRLAAEIAAQLAPHLPLVCTVGAIAVDEQNGDGRWSMRALVPLAGHRST